MGGWLRRSTVDSKSRDSWWRTLYSALARGMPGPAVAPANFVEILERVWWRLDRALDADSIAMSARVGIAEAAAAGATCLIDHHESPNCIDGSLDLIADEFQRAGMRGVVAYGITARNGGEAEWRAGLAETERFLRAGRGLWCAAWSACTRASRCRTRRWSPRGGSRASTASACTSMSPRTRWTATRSRASPPPMRWCPAAFTRTACTWATTT